MPIAYKCVVCGEWCEQAPTDDGWMSVSVVSLGAIHFRCLEHIWKLYKGVTDPTPRCECGREMTARVEWACPVHGEEFEL